MKYYLVFFLAAFADCVWVLYVRRLAEGKALRGAFWAMVIFFIGGWVTVEYVKDIGLLIPAALGAFTGTYLTVLYDSRRKRYLKYRAKMEALYASEMPEVQDGE